MKKLIVFQLLIIALLAMFPFVVFGDEKNNFEIGVGAGTDMSGIASKDVLLTPAFNMPISANGNLRARLEGDFELINYTGRTVFVGGIAPFLKLLPFGWKVNPFIEIGAGANLITSRTIANQEIDGPFLFSLMSGAGIEMMINKALVSLSYRFRHLSNGDIYKHNQSLNTQYIMLSIGL